MHPLFVQGRGKSKTPLATQCCLLLLNLNNVSHAAIRRLLKINHEALEALEQRLCDLRKTWVEVKEKGANFGHGKPWGDVEADEATFDKKTWEPMRQIQPRL